MIDLHLSDASGVPFYRQVQDQIADGVRSGQLVAGALLPSVRELAATLCVSAITTRRAYAELEALGLIVRQRGRGTYVADDVVPKAEAWAHERATEGLRDAIDHARTLGLTDDQILEAVASLVPRSVSS